MTGDNSKIFDRALYRKRRDRAAAWQAYDFLKKEAAGRLADRLQDIRRIFPLALDIGCHHGEVGRALAGSPQVGRLFQTEMSARMASRAGGDVCICDEEFLPFASGSFDLVVSALSLHHVNDLPGSFIQIREMLKPDGLFLAILPGALTLKELRESVALAAAEGNVPLSPRVSPFVEVRDAGALLQRAGFALPVIDSDTVTVEYDNAFRLMEELRGMGESNVLEMRQKHFTTRRQLEIIASSYHRHFAPEGGAVPATVELVTLTAWKPHATQPRPLARGSGQTPLKQALS